MSAIPLTDALRQEYQRLWDTCEILPARLATAEILANSLVANRPHYQAVGGRLGIPWGFIGAIHNMESSQNFRRHLHNGDPLSARTVHVPAGRPVTGQPPFSWEDSAADALLMHGLGAHTDWSIAGTLYQLERFNGFGYRLYHPHVLTPYLWSFSNHYSAGKYVGDGEWSDTAVSMQCGAVVLLRLLAQRGDLDKLAPAPPPAHPVPPAAPVHEVTADDLNAAELARIQGKPA